MNTIIPQSSRFTQKTGTVSISIAIGDGTETRSTAVVISYLRVNNNGELRELKAFVLR